ncbi:hypothetical protein DPMN_155647 [Dreissena polymorpha]|uniref:Uncharacterized protein n=1 Tax=Dreissena polymorpha TaxID=45954 RepID=A0A9D4JBJ9_DREPO|nr:hypothetical protein DPMN_155647 [Dreissena polymorpha]
MSPWTPWSGPLQQTCDENELHTRNRMSWMHPHSNHQYLIDYVILRKSYRRDEHCQVKDCQLQAFLCKCSGSALDWALLRKLIYATTTDTLGTRNTMTGLMIGH